MENEVPIVVSDYENCVRCPDLCEHRGSIVWGYGVPTAPIFLLGEGPGASEDKKGVPFCGNAGDKLWEMLEEAHIPTSLIYTSNAVLCRAMRALADSGRVENRKPTTAEIQNCRPRLMRELEKVDPFIIVALGGAALASLVGKDIPMKRVLGKVFDVKIRTRNDYEVRYPVMPCYHPSYFLKGTHPEDHYLHSVGALKFVKKIVDFAMGNG